MDFDQSTRRPFELDYSTDDRSIFNFFNQVYAWMAVGLAVTGSTAWLVSHNLTMLRAIHNRGMAVAILLGSVLIVWGIRSAATRISANVATLLFLVYSVLIGAALSGIFVIYDLGSIAGVFAITAGTFAAMSVYGYVTKRDLSGLGSFFFMALIGLFIATLVNIFVASTMLDWLISYVGLFLFIGLTAYDTQKLKHIAYDVQRSPDAAARMAILGSLELYLDFINMFIFLLRILGKRR